MAGLDPGEEANALREDVVALEVVGGRDVAGEEAEIESGSEGSAETWRGMSSGNRGSFAGLTGARLGS